MSASKAAIVAMPVGVRGDAGDVWRAAIGCGGFVGARGWPDAVHVCYESRLLPPRRACDEHKYWRAMKLRCSKNDARARAAATEFCRHLSTRLETCSRVLRRCCITFDGARQSGKKSIAKMSADTREAPTYEVQIADKGPQETPGRVL